MSLNERLRRADGSEFGAYVSRPEGKPRGAVVVLQEIFGVNIHIRDVADRFAAEGYVAIAPSLFDRYEPGLELDYNPDDAQRGRDIKNKLTVDECMTDVRACVEAVADAGPVAVVGFCWGGFLAWQAAAQVEGLSAAVGYYGGGIPQNAADLQVRVPVMLHFGREDQMIPVAEVERFKAERDDVEVYLYDAGHGFNCDRRDSYDAPSAKLAWERTQGFLQRHLGG